MFVMCMLQLVRDWPTCERPRRHPTRKTSREERRAFTPPQPQSARPAAPATLTKNHLLASAALHSGYISLLLLPQNRYAKVYLVKGSSPPTHQFYYNHTDPKDKLLSAVFATFVDRTEFYDQASDTVTAET